MSGAARAGRKVQRMSEKKGTSAMAIAGLVLGIIAAVSSWVPIVNNLSFVIGIIGLVLAAVGLIGTVRGKRSGKGLAIAAVVVNVVALAVVLASQSAMSAAIDEATSSPDVTGVSSSEGAADQQGGSAEQATTDLAAGTSVSLDNGLTVTVDSVETGVTNYDGSSLMAAHVTYANNGDEPAAYNTYDWKGEDANGAQEYATYYSETTDDLSSGTLAAGGTKSGTVYFVEGTVKVLYFGSALSDTPSASWVVA